MRHEVVTRMLSDPLLSIAREDRGGQETSHFRVQALMTDGNHLFSRHLLFSISGSDCLHVVEFLPLFTPRIDLDLPPQIPLSGRKQKIEGGIVRMEHYFSRRFSDCVLLR